MAEQSAAVGITENVLTELRQNNQAEQSANNTTTETQAPSENQSGQDRQLSAHLKTADESKDGVTALSKRTEAVERQLQAILCKLDSLSTSNQSSQNQTPPSHYSMYLPPPPYYPPHVYPYGHHHNYHGSNLQVHQPTTNSIDNNWTLKPQPQMMNGKPQDNESRLLEVPKDA